MTVSQYQGSVFKSLSVVNAGQQIGSGFVTLKSITVTNRHATLERFIKFYNKTSAPVIGTDVPVVTIPIQFLSDPVTIPINASFDLGCWIAATGALADNDNTAPSANDVVVSGIYN
jgi:hypothetical protein